MLLAVPAFLVHALIPLRYRLMWYLAVSFTGIVLVLGLRDALWLIAIVCAFVGICHLPLALRWRVLLLLAAGGGFGYVKVSSWLAPWSNMAWPIIASILMFRLIIYLYDLHHDKGRPPLAWSLSYFFLLPNVCFPLFPVVDFKKFRSTYYSEPSEAIYKRGVLWIFRGIYQLLLYRVVYQFLVIPPSEVLDAYQLLQFMLSAYLLYLRVSGLFHLIIGILLMFGFNLPETHKRYYLASSFNDFWRRINIYWKDFMMKIFYYPVYFKAKSLGPTPALIIATITVFLCTWALHAYQWFWLRGSMLFEAHDLLFWAVLGVLVVVNSLHEIKHGRDRVSTNRPLLSFASLAHACRVIATFSALCILWSMWSSDSLEQWLLMWGAAGSGSIVIIAVVPVFYLLAVWLDRRSGDQPQLKRSLASTRSAVTRPPPIAAHAFSGAAVFALTGLVVVSLLDTALIPDQVADAASRIRTDQLNRRDNERMERGYYEHLLNVNRHSDQLWQALDTEPADWPSLDESAVALLLDNFSLIELRPSMEISFKGAHFRTNRWGMRDREYELMPPPGTTRVAFMGTSHVLGSGVANEDVFEQTIEEKLNATNVTDGQNFEILNFSIASYSALQQLLLLENKVAGFKPDVIVYFQMEEDERFILRNLSMAIRAGFDIPFGFVREIVEELGLDSSRTDGEIRRALRPHALDILAWAETQLLVRIREIGANPVCVMLSRVQTRPEQEVAEKRLRVAFEAGCHTINLADVYDGYGQGELQIATWDAHPNARAHQMIAARLYDEFVANPEMLISRSDDASRF